MPPPLIAPSLLAANPLDFKEEILHLQHHTEADRLHLDVMDGHFVPAISFGAGLIKAIRHLTTLPLDVHLMITPTASSVHQFIEAGPDSIAIHYEADKNLTPFLEAIKKAKIKAALAINPRTSYTLLIPFLPLLDQIVIMTVVPGECGQPFLPEIVGKVQALKKLIVEKNLPIRLVVDGGITLKTAPIALLAGAHILVSGSGLFSFPREQRASVIKKMKELPS